MLLTGKIVPDFRCLSIVNDNYAVYFFFGFTSRRCQLIFVFPSGIVFEPAKESRFFASVFPVTSKLEASNFCSGILWASLVGGFSGLQPDSDLFVSILLKRVPPGVITTIL